MDCEDEGFEEEYVYSDDDSAYSDDDKGAEEHLRGEDDKGMDCKGDVKASPGSNANRSRAGSFVERNVLDEVPDEGTFIMKSYDDIAPFMDKLVSEVQGLLDCHADLSRLLLQAARWDKEKLMEEYFNDAEKFYKKNGVDLFDSECLERLRPEKSAFMAMLKASAEKESEEKLLADSKMIHGLDEIDGKTDVDLDEEKGDDSNYNSKRESMEDFEVGAKRTKSEQEQKEQNEQDEKQEKQVSSFQCSICYDNCSGSEAVALGCDHTFCFECYNGYLKSAVGDGPACIHTHCPEFNCNQKVPRMLFVKVVEPAVLREYDTYLKRNFIESIKTMRYCPAPGCTKVAVGCGVSNVKCTCENLFCFKCGDDAHDPCTCGQLAEWSERCNNESETANWILANTKKCPKCSSRIEKNSGCNHMVCKLCKHEFCWTCLGIWADHGQTTGGFYKCNRFEAKSLRSDATEAEKAKADLDRYLHYYQRYHNHDHSLKFAAKQREHAERKMLESQEASKASWLDVQYNMQAVEQVIACRRILKYTYVLGFWLSLQDDNQERTLFEYHQEMLEKNTERLQECTEERVEADDALAAEKRTQVVNLTRVTEKFMASLLTSLAGGYVQQDDDVSMMKADMS